VRKGIPVMLISLDDVVAHQLTPLVLFDQDGNG